MWKLRKFLFVFECGTRMGENWSSVLGDEDSIKRWGRFVLYTRKIVGNRDDVVVGCICMLE